MNKYDKINKNRVIRKSGCMKDQQIIKFESQIITIDSTILVKLPEEVSKKLPSRGMVMVTAIINSSEITLCLEPDGKFSHWFELDEHFLKSINKNIGDTLTMTISNLSEWIEPAIPEDFLKALQHEQILSLWDNLTAKAKWDWIRWFRFTKNPKTREKRIGIAISKLLANDKRPCCFDRSRCTITQVSNSGVLKD